jgi:L-ascorbate 6-phosphate lactonase
MAINYNSDVELIRDIKDTQVPYGMLAIWFLGQCSIVIKGGDTIIGIDPYLSPSPHRAFEPPLTPEQLAIADYILITHDHSDHLDTDTIAGIATASRETLFMAPGFCQQSMRQLGLPQDRLFTARTNLWWEGHGWRIKPIPSAHEELEYDSEQHHRFVGYVVDLNGVKLYHAGDTIVYPGLIEALTAESIDVGLLPINGRDAFRQAQGIVGNMNYREAAELSVAACFDTVIPMHYDMFAGNSERPGYFIDYLYEHYPRQKSHVMARCERFIYVSRSWGRIKQ